MANPYGYQFITSKHPSLALITGSVTFGATGAVGTVAGNGVQGVTRLTTGIYEIKLVESWPAFIKFIWAGYSGVTGSNVNDGSFVTGTLYQIITVGTTTWSSAGFDSNYTPTVGACFVATGVGGAGTGTAKAVTTSGIGNVELARSQSGLLQNLYPSQGKGSAFIVQTLGYTGSLADPTNGSQLGFGFFLRNSSVAY